MFYKNQGNILGHSPLFSILFFLRFASEKITRTDGGQASSSVRVFFYPAVAGWENVSRTTKGRRIFWNTRLCSRYIFFLSFRFGKNTRTDGWGVVCLNQFSIHFYQYFRIVKNTLLPDGQARTDGFKICIENDEGNG